MLFDSVPSLRAQTNKSKSARMIKVVVLLLPRKRFSNWKCNIPLKSSITYISSFYSTKSSPSPNVKTTNTAPTSTAPTEDAQTDDTHIHKFYEQRYTLLKENESKTGKSSYAPHMPTSHTIANYVESFKHIKNGERLESENVTIAGRINSRREASAKLIFYGVSSGGTSLQVMANMKQYNNAEDFTSITSLLRKGDVIGVRGFPGRTNVGELSIIPREITLLTPCMNQIPDPARFVLKQKEQRYRQRYLDMLVNPWVKQCFITRSKVISFLRAFLVERGFLEMETPTLSPSVGGANARPFVTTSNALSMPLFLRISPELFLKQLVIGGIERVFEIGKQFRNEGVDLTHNPEFTTCEFYQAYADYTDLMKMTETLLNQMVVHITGSTKVTLPRFSHSDELKPQHATPSHSPESTSRSTVSADDVIIDFTPPFQRIHFIPKLRECLGPDFPENFNSYDSIPKMLELCARHNIHAASPHTPSRMLDLLSSHFIEPMCIQPTFVCDHPLALSPLAKQHRNDPQVTERFELFIGGKEFVNAYSELNDPREQRSRFVAQAVDRGAGDLEAPPPDENFCDALEYGLPPTAGWGLGIDRLCMLLTGTNSIKDVLLFPIMKPKDN